MDHVETAISRDPPHNQLPNADTIAYTSKILSKGCINRIRPYPPHCLQYNPSQSDTALPLPDCSSEKKKTGKCGISGRAVLQKNNPPRIKFPSHRSAPHRQPNHFSYAECPQAFPEAAARAARLLTLPALQPRKSPRRFAPVSVLL